MTVLNAAGANAGGRYLEHDIVQTDSHRVRGNDSVAIEFEDDRGTRRPFQDRDALAVDQSANRAPLHRKQYRNIRTAVEIRVVAEVPAAADADVVSSTNHRREVDSSLGIEAGGCGANQTPLLIEQLNCWLKRERGRRGANRDFISRRQIHADKVHVQARREGKRGIVTDHARRTEQCRSACDPRIRRGRQTIVRFDGQIDG